MATVGDVYEYIDSIAPFNTQMDFDNSGLLVGSSCAPLRRVYVCLDADLRAVSEASRLGCELIISHHPAIFEPLYSIKTAGVPYELVRAGMALISAHTNLDIAECGVNSCLAERLRLNAAKRPEGVVLGVLGELGEALEPPELAKLCREKLGGSVHFNKGGRAIKRLGAIGGSASDFTQAIFDLGADAIVTGEVKHHMFLEAQDMGVTLFAAGHYETEHTVVAPLRELLSRAIPEIEFIAAPFDPPTQSV